MESPRTSRQPPASFISDLRPSRVATLEAVVARLDPVREVETKVGGTRRVREALLKDPTGEITLVLWGDEVDRVRLGERVRVVDGWVAERRGRPQISVGRAGRLEPVATD